MKFPLVPLGGLLAWGKTVSASETNPIFIIVHTHAESSLRKS
jgi:hypothetical protein